MQQGGMGMGMGAHMIPVIDPQFCLPQEVVYLIKEDLMSASGELSLQHSTHRKLPGRSPDRVCWPRLKVGLHRRSIDALEGSSTSAWQG